jgi:lipid-A-disaccharide synthase-like uncharacterized protein
MQALIGEVLAKLAAEPFGLLGGGLFFFSWVVQSWESKQAQKPTVSARFFAIRILGCLLLAIEGYRIESASLLLISTGTAAMNSYNIWLLAKRRDA